MTTLGSAGKIRGRAWTSLVLGVLIFGVPLVFAQVDEYTNFTWSNYAVGAAVVVLAAIGIWAAKKSLMTLAWVEGINALLGVWTVVTPFVFPSDTNPMYANIVLGAALFVVAAWDAYVSMMESGGRATRRSRTA